MNEAREGKAHEEKLAAKATVSRRRKDMVAPPGATDATTPPRHHRTSKSASVSVTRRPRNHQGLVPATLVTSLPTRCQSAATRRPTLSTKASTRSAEENCGPPERRRPRDQAAASKAHRSVSQSQRASRDGRHSLPSPTSQTPAVIGGGVPSMAPNTAESQATAGRTAGHSRRACTSVSTRGPAAAEEEDGPPPCAAAHTSDAALHAVLAQQQ